MPRASASRSNPLFAKPRTSPIVALFVLILVIVASYFCAVIDYIITYRLVRLPGNNFFLDDGTRTSLQYILLIISVVASLVPMFNREWDPTLRRFGVFTAFFIVLFTAGRQIGIFTLDPSASLQTIARQVVDPLTHTISIRR